jgi:hypothetical protein
MSSGAPDPYRPPAEAAPRAAATPWWRRALPFAIAIALVALTLRRIDMDAFVAQLAAVNAPAYFLFAIAFVLALLTADAFATAWLYRLTVAPVGFGELWALRGASYLPSIVSHHLGQAYLTYAVSRRHGVSLARMAGGTLLSYASWAGLLLAAFSVAMVVSGRSLWEPAAALTGGVVYLAVIAWRPRPLAGVKLLAPLFEAGLRGHIVGLLVRVPHFVVLFLGTWLPFFFFGVSIPLAAALLYVPIVMVAVTLPITPQGIGTREVAAVWAFSAFAPGATHAAQAAAISASTASFAVAFTLVEVVLGLALLRWATPEATPSSLSLAPKVHDA